MSVQRDLSLLFLTRTDTLIVLMVGNNISVSFLSNVSITVKRLEEHLLNVHQMGRSVIVFVFKSVFICAKKLSLLGCLFAEEILVLLSRLITPIHQKVERGHSQRSETTLTINVKNSA